ncbi:hypothetical protein ACGP04_13055 [Piscirickettsia salmonis]|uniref:magnesium chelatase subunit ChlI family protein n=1 Tax=Piscirickettsia salmonis TaxID=1238 RepID=UPI003753E2D9
MQNTYRGSDAYVEVFCSLGQQESNLLTRAIEKFGLSARVYHRLLKVARTIADLEQSTDIKLPLRAMEC